MAKWSLRSLVVALAVLAAVAAEVSDEDKARALKALPNAAFGEFGYCMMEFATRANVARMGTPRPDDIFIGSYPKSGTNWVKQMVHLIRLRADAERLEQLGSTDLSELVPYIEGDSTIEFDELLEPRTVFTHLRYGDLPKGARYIYVYRQLTDVVPSYYKYVKAFGDIFFANHTVDDAAELAVAGLLYGGTWEEHVASYWAERDNPRVLLLKYEDIKHDHVSQVVRIATFLGVDLSPDELERVVEMSSMAYMKGQNEQIQGKKWAARVTGQNMTHGYKLCDQGKVGDGSKRFKSETLQAFERHFPEKATPLLGAATYAELDATSPLRRLEGEL